MKNRMIRKMMAVVAAGAAAVSLAACGGAEGSSAAGSSGTAAESSAASASSAGETAAAGSAASASAGKSFKVGIVQYVDDASLNQIEKNIETELDTLAEKNGVTYDYEDYTFNGQADGTTLNQIASELISDKVDAIVAIATPTAQIMQSATEGTDIPVIFSAVSDPVGAKLVESNDKPGSNITGTSDALNTEAIMNLILAQNPDTKKVGLLYSKSEDSSTQPIADAKAFLDKKGISYVEKTGTTNDEVASAADALVAEKVDAVFTPTDNTIMKAELSIYEKFTDAGIAQYCGADSFALNGAFLGYGVDYANLGVITADMVNQVLAEGADPAETPVETFDNGIATINTDTAEALGLNMDDLKTAFADYCEKIQETTTAKEFE